MSPHGYITQWRERIPWNEDVQIEQDVIVRRALAVMFCRPVLAEASTFRASTALYSLPPDATRTLFRGHQCDAGRGSDIVPV